MHQLVVLLLVGRGVAVSDNSVVVNVGHLSTDVDGTTFHLPTATHHTGMLHHLAVHGEDSEVLVLPEAYILGRLDVVTHQRVRDDLVEGHPVLLPLGVDEVE